MKTFLTTVKFDYLQRTRSYSFLITLCIALSVGYSFVPEPNASYSTISIGGYMGSYNSAWIGYVTAIMTSIFLSLIGFFLINNSITNDQKTKMGQIVAATSITNFKYLISKVLSNFLVLLTIAFVVLVMSVILFFSYNAGYPFELFQFIKPYVFVTVPALFFISVLAIVFEIVFGRFSILQNIAFFFLFISLLVFRPDNETGFSMDIFGSKIVMHQMEEAVEHITGVETTVMNIGYTINNKENKTFDFEGVHFPISFVASRALWILFGIMIIVIITPFFHRYNLKEKISGKRKAASTYTEIKTKSDLVLSGLSIPQSNYGVFQIVKTEFLMLIRKGKKWLWIFNLVGVVLLAVLPLNIAHTFVLPILWFLQVGRLSDLGSKELINKVHYFAFTSFKPLSRLLLSQLLSSIVLMLLLALPLIIRLGINVQITALLLIVVGGVFIVLLAALLGVLTKGKKLFEVLFFMVTYANVNSIEFLDYFGAFRQSKSDLFMLLLLVFLTSSFCFLLRKFQLKRL